MTKEEYLSIIQKPEVPMSLWFEYYREREGMITNFDEFVRIFSNLMWHQVIIKKIDGSAKKVDFQSALRNLYEYYAKKFNLW